MNHPLASYVAAVSASLLLSCAVDDLAEPADGDALSQVVTPPRPAPSYNSFETALRVMPDAGPPLTDEVYAE